MNDDVKRPNRDDEVDTGEAIAELASLRESPAQGFGDRIRNSIQRRMFAADTADFSLRVFLQTMFDYMTAAFDAFRGPEPPKNGSK